MPSVLRRLSIDIEACEISHKHEKTVEWERPIRILSTRAVPDPGLLVNRPSFVNLSQCDEALYYSPYVAERMLLTRVLLLDHYPLELLYGPFVPDHRNASGNNA